MGGRLDDVSRPIVEEIEAVYRRDHARLVGLAEWLVGRSGLAEELVHDVFVRVVENPPTIRSEVGLGPYLRAAVVNGCRSRLRRLVLERRTLAAGREEEGSSPRETDRDVREAVLVLPMRQRQAVVLRFYDDLTVPQIAEVLGISEGSVKTHLHRAMQTLGSSLRQRSVT